MEQLSKIRRTPLTNQAVDILTEYIVNGDMKVGAFLPSEQALCERIGIGRSTLREAVKVLESRGLVSRVPGKGVQVVDESDRAATDVLKVLLSRSDSSLKDLVEVRGIFEIEAAALAARRAKPEDIRRMEEAFTAMQSPTVPMDEYIRADLQFHLAMVKATYNRVLAFIMQTISPLLHTLITESQKGEPRPERYRGYHKKVFEAVRDGDPARAAQAMREHHVAMKEMLGMDG